MSTLLKLIDQSATDGRKPKSLPSSPAFVRRTNRLFNSVRIRRSVKVKSEVKKESMSNPSSPRLKRQSDRYNLQKTITTLSPTLPPTVIMVSPTDDKEEPQRDSPPNDTTPTQTSSQSQLTVDQKLLKNVTSGVSMDSGIGNDNSRSDLQDGVSSSDILSKADSKSHHQHDKGVGSRSMDRETIPGPQLNVSSDTFAVKKGKDKHPRSLFFVKSSSNSNSLCSLPKDDQVCSLNPESRQSALDTSPTESNVSTASSASCRSRRGSISYPPSVRSRRPSIGPKLYRVTPRKYLNKSRATSALHLVSIYVTIFA